MPVCADSEICLQSLQNASISAKMLKMPICHASVHTHDAESDMCMNIILKYNTCVIKPHRHHLQTVNFIFSQIWIFLYRPVLLTVSSIFAIQFEIALVRYYDISGNFANYRCASTDIIPKVRFCCAHVTKDG